MMIKNGWKMLPDKRMKAEWCLSHLLTCLCTPIACIRNETLITRVCREEENK